ncbi:ABC transporter substrate-binding protein [Gluconacetobacter tumulisoli]|uniref:Solute-binding protein family 5 domain-containing protein n=1 Tax=Gluconacetobacter tumulisoli TaxID=1286189 RepID=A0A7W4K9X4_9PROT|nr:ABC transporter substrate-binding protein [Gluconacetobacter tumulisoli]MBB2203037.1 hypothetical protein [Gluconacetobacter tumulisoli]
MTTASPPALTIAQEKVDFFPANRVTDDRSILTLKALVMEPLCMWRDGRIFPALFARWECDAQGTVWHFHLRPDAVFHDGHRCTAMDVVAFIDAICTSVDMFGMKWSYARYFADVHFDALSDDTLRVTTARPMGDLPEIFTEFYLSRQDAHARAVIGTGRYRVTQFTPGVSATLHPAVVGTEPELTFFAVPKAEDRLERLRTGRIDLACQMDCLEDVSDLTPDVQWLGATHCLSVMAYLNCSRGLFRSAEARLAANLAIDNAALCREIYDGLAIPAATIVSPYHNGFAEAGITPLPYDPDAARALLAPLGFTGEVVLRTPTFMPEHAPKIAGFIKRALEDLGLDVRIDTATDRPGYAREIGNKAMGDIAIFDSSPHSTFRVLNDKISRESHGVWWQGFDDDAVETLIARANETIDPTARAAAYGACLAHLREAPPWLYLAHPKTLVATRPGLHGIGLDHKGILHLEPEHRT